MDGKKFVLGLSLELPIFNRHEGPIAEAEARRRHAGAQFLALQARVIGESEQALARYQGAIAALKEADDLVTALEMQEKATRRAVEVGASDRLVLTGVRLQRIAAARARLESLRRAQTALGALEDVVQRPITPTGTIPNGTEK
ncbi:MAG: TolC family protein [Planctomycetes bacterium]|nr:TolC family protein [Planctomycetota bacterium]